MNVGATINADIQPIKVQAKGGPPFVRAYQDSEIAGPVKGTAYFNTTSGTARIFDGNSWAAFGGGGGGSGNVIGSSLTNGQLLAGAGGSNIATGNLSGDVTTSGSLATQVTGLHLASPPSCTNQVIRALSAAASPTCVTVTSAYVDTSIAQTGVDINTSNQVTALHLTNPINSTMVNNTIALTGGDLNTSSNVVATHLTAALPANQGGSGVTGTVHGNSTHVQLSDNTGGSGHCAQFDANGNIVDFPASCATAANAAGSNTQVQFNNGGLAFGASPNLTFVSPALTIGAAGSALGRLNLAGSTSGTTALTTAVAAGGTWTFPNATDQIIGRATTDTLTNKTYDTGGTGNVFKIAGTTISAIHGNAARVQTSDNTGTSGNIAAFDANGNIVDGGILATNVVSKAAGNTYSTGAQNFSSATSLTVPSGAGAAPTAAGSLAFDSTAKTLNFGDGSANNVTITASSASVLTNKTYDTAGTGNVFKINGTAISDITGTGKVVLDTGPTIASPIIGTQLSIGGTTNQIKFSGIANNITLTAPNPASARTYTFPDSGGNNTIALTSGALVTGDCAKFDANGNLVDFGGACGGTGAPGGSDTQVQFNSSSSFGGSAGLTWVSPTLTVGQSGTNTGNLAFGGATSGVTNLTTVTAAGGSWTLRNATDNVVGEATTDTFTNKTFDTAGTGNVFDVNGTAISDKTGTGKVVLDNGPTLTAPVLGAATATSINKVALTAPSTAAALAFGTDNATITFQGTDTYLGRATTDTLTNKTYDTAGTGNVFKINGVQITSVKGNSAIAQLQTGATTTNDCAKFDANGNIVDAGAACGTGGSGTIGGSIVAPQVGFGSASNTLSGSNNFTYSATSGTSLIQGANAADMEYGKRFTDTGPTGNFWHYQNAAAGADVAKLDVNGNLITVGGVTTGAGATVAGQASIGQGTAPVPIANSWNLASPAAVTGSPQIIFPASAATGLPHLANSSGVMTMTIGAVDLSGADASGLLAAARMPALTGDVTNSPGSLTTTVGKVNGVAFPASPALHTVPIVTASNTATYKAIPDCSGASNVLLYSQTGDAFSCGTIASSGTVVSGTTNQLAYYASSTNAVSGNANATISGGALTLGVTTSVIGQLKLAGNSSGTVTLTPQAAAGTYTLTLPATAGANLQFLQTDGSGNLAWASPSGSGTVNSGTAGHLAYYASSTTAVSDLGADFTFNTHTLAMGASGILDLSAASPTAGFKVPTAAGGAPTADGFVAFDSTTHTLEFGSNGSNLSAAAWAGDIGGNVAISPQVTATHLTAPLPGAQGGTASQFFAVAGPASSLKTFTFPNASANVLTDNALVTAAQGGTANGFFAVSGPATSTKTFTFPNASANVLTDNALVTAAQGGTGNGFFAVSGPATSTKTFTFPNASANVLTDNAAVTIAQGGTGTGSTLTGLVRGSATAMTAAELSGAVTTSGSNVASLATPYVTRQCEIVIGGTDTANALKAGDDAIANNSCFNKLGVTETITAVYCKGDPASNTVTVNPTFGAAGTGTTILAGALTCGSSEAYSTMTTGCSGGACTISNGALTDGTGIDVGMGGTPKGTNIHVIIKYTVPAS